ANLAGTNTVTGQVTLNAATTVSVATGSALVLSGAIGQSVAADLTKVGLGDMTLSGTAANTYTGTTTVNAGSLFLNKTAGVNAVGGSLTIGDNVGTDT